ncbi:MAG: S-layer homology domain-containing protein [Oscillospiraceae bacterium]|nr:S-layer homology domain-containing protein [Oscillospiraceae bacterium]
MRSKTASILLSIAMIISLFSGLSTTAYATAEHWTDGVMSDTLATYSGGTGTSDDPFMLATAQDLAQLSVNVRDLDQYSFGKYFRIKNSISLAEKLWTPIGRSPSTGSGEKYGFMGSFDGDGHVITGMTLDSSSASDERYWGFFGTIYGGSGTAEVFNLGLEHASIDVSEKPNARAGILAGFGDDNSRITGCSVSGTVAVDGGARVGGFAGECYSQTGHDMVIDNCCFTGTVSGGASGLTAHFSSASSATIRNCWCAVSSTGVGFVSGTVPRTVIDHCYYDTTLNTSGSSGGATGKTTEEMQSADMVALLNGSQNPAPWQYVAAHYPVLSWVDITAPSLTGGAVWRSDATTATVCLLSDEAGTCYYQVTGSATPPASVVTGGTSGGMVAAGTTASIALSGLTSGAMYAHMAVCDTSGNVSEPLTISLPCDYYYYNGFETDSLDSVPAGWTKMYSNPGIAQVSSTTAAAGAHSFLLDGYTINASAYYLPIDSAPDSLVFEAYICPASFGDEAGGISLWNMKSGTDYWMASVSFKNGYIYTQNGTGANARHDLCTYSVDTWYHVEILHDFISHTYRVYINGELKSTELNIYGGSGPTRAILSSGNDADGCTCYFDNVKLYEPPVSRYAVTFSQNDGGTSESTYYIAANTSDFYTAATGGNVHTLTLPTRLGYTFGGWYKETGCTTQIINSSLALCAGTVYTDNNPSANWTKEEAVTLYAKWLETTPMGLDLDYENEQITGLAANADYSISGVNVAADTNGKTAIQSGWFDTSLSIVKKGAAANSSFDSAAATLIVPARPSAPTGLTAVDESYSGAGDGKITGVDETMVYKVSTASDWTAVVSGATEIAGLDDGTYYVRYQAVASGSPAFASAYVTITIGTTGAAPEIQPAASINYPGEKLSSLTAGSEYDIGGMAYTADVSGEIAIPNDWFGTTISIVKKSNGTTTTNSTAQNLTLSARPTTPSISGFTVTQPTASVLTGTVAGITTAMAYSTDGGTSWIEGSGDDVTGLAAGNIIIRVKATDTAPKSGSLTITITAYQAPSGGVTPVGGGGTQDITKSVKIISEDGVTTATGTVTTIDNGLSVSIPSGEIDRLAGSRQHITVKTDTVTVGFDADAMAHIGSAAGSNAVVLEIVRVAVDSLSEADRQLVGDHPVYNFGLTAGSTAISGFGTGSASVGIPYTPAAGEDVNAIVVYYLSDSSTLETMRGRYNAATGMVEFTTKHFSKYAVGYNKVAFSDVDVGDWFENAVTFIAARGVTKGTGDGIFSPYETLTRGQFIVMLMRAYGIEADTNSMDNFSDAGNTYYTNYLAAAKRLGISNGIGDNKFAPDGRITRQEMFTLLYRAMNVLGEIPEAIGSKTTGDFEDAGQISDYAETAMYALVGAGIISGNGGKLNPIGTTSRAEMAQVLYNLMRKS